MSPQNKNSLHRREAIGSAFKAVGLTALSASALEAQEQINRNAPIAAKDNLKITKLETFLVKPRWLFLKIHTNAGIVGLGEPITEGRALTCATAVKEVEPYLVGKDPRQVVQHWQAIYRHAFYRGGPILTSALSGIDMALWDIKGKALGVPIYELLGGPTRDRVRVYAHAEQARPNEEPQGEGIHRIQDRPSQEAAGVPIHRNAGRRRIRRGAVCRTSPGDGQGRRYRDRLPRRHQSRDSQAADPGLRAVSADVHREPCQAQNHDIMAEIARGTYLPIATGERLFTKWGFREVLEKKSATILQPDLCHAGGITEVRLIAGMAEAYYADVAPHNPLGPISLAAGVQLSASIPNFLCQEQVASAKAT